MSAPKRVLSRTLAMTFVLVCAVALAQAQTPSAAPRAPSAPGVTRSVEHPAVTPDQTQPDDRQPETAVDKDNLKPETATDAKKPTKAEDLAKKGVRSNAPPQPHRA